MADSPLLPAAKRQLGITSTVDDALLNDLIAAAVDHVERETGLVLTRREVVEHVVPGALRLRSWPIVSVDAVSYRDHLDVEQQLASDLFRPEKVRRPATLTLLGTTPWPARCAALAVTVTAGYAALTDAPALVRQAIMVLVAEFYANREAGAISDAAQQSLGWLLQSHRVRTL